MIDASPDAWRTYAAAALTGLLRVEHDRRSVPYTAALAAEYADAMVEIEAKREFTQSMPPGVLAVAANRASTDPSERRRKSHHESFMAELERRFASAQANGAKYVDVEASEIHGAVTGDSPHNMPVCSRVLRQAMEPGDEILASPPNGYGASLRIRYQLPRSSRKKTKG